MRRRESVYSSSHHLLPSSDNNHLSHNLPSSSPNFFSHKLTINDFQLIKVIGEMVDETDDDMVVDETDFDMVVDETDYDMVDEMNFS